MERILGYLRSSKKTLILALRTDRNNGQESHQEPLYSFTFGAIWPFTPCILSEEPCFVLLCTPGYLRMLHVLS
jgi:hypothetical protein